MSAVTQAKNLVHERPDMSDDILYRLRDLHKQATTERSHFYVAKCCNDAIAEIERLHRALRGVMEAAESHDEDACHELARKALAPVDA